MWMVWPSFQEMSLRASVMILSNWFNLNSSKTFNIVGIDIGASVTYNKMSSANNEIWCEVLRKDIQLIEGCCLIVWARSLRERANKTGDRGHLWREPLDIKSVQSVWNFLTSFVQQARSAFISSSLPFSPANFDSMNLCLGWLYHGGQLVSFVEFDLIRWPLVGVEPFKWLSCIGRIVLYPYTQI